MKVVIVAVMNLANGCVSFEYVVADRTSAALYKVAGVKGKGYLVAYSGQVWGEAFDGKHFWQVLDGQSLESVML